MKFYIILIALFSAAEAISFSASFKLKWRGYKLVHKKEYTNSNEENSRKKIFKENVNIVAKHNQLYKKGLVSYNLKVNKWADVSHSEFVKTYNGYNHNASIKLRPNVFALKEDNIELPDSIDWRELGAVTPVKDQGKCASCWSFSSTGALEAQHFLKTGKLVSLSEQNLLDCTRKYGNDGCIGGSSYYAFEYIKANRGVDTEESYPYEEKELRCRYKAKNIGSTLRSFKEVARNDEDQLKTVVGTIGPVAVGVDASRDTFQFYSSGVYYDPECSSTNITHALLVIGYGTNEDGLDYWLVKNSFGTEWGEQGYGKIARNKDNHCGIAFDARYPVV